MASTDRISPFYGAFDRRLRPFCSQPEDIGTVRSQKYTLCVREYDAAAQRGALVGAGENNLGDRKTRCQKTLENGDESPPSTVRFVERTGGMVANNDNNI